MLKSWQRHRIARRRVRCNRIAKNWLAQPSWRTRLRTQARRALPGLPLSEEEFLLAAKPVFAGLSARPIDHMRLLRPLSDVMLAADGRTSFRYFKVSKAACSSVVQMLLAACGRGQDFSLTEKHVRPRIMARMFVYRGKTCVIALNGAGWHGEPFFCRDKLFCSAPHADIRFCVVRDPVERFLSAFDDIVMRRQFYAPTPSLEVFLQRLEETMEDVREESQRMRAGFRPGAFARDMHFCPQYFWLGEDAAYFTHIFNLRQLPQLRELLSDLAGEKIPLVHANARPSHRRTELTAEQKKRAAALYARDYELFGRWF